MQESKVSVTRASLLEVGQKVANLEAELQEVQRLIAAGTPEESEVGEGSGENVRALSVESDDELAGGLGPDDDYGTAVRVLGGAGV